MAFGNIFDAFVRDYFATDGKMIKGKAYPVIGSSSTKMFKALKKEVDKLKESFNRKFGEGKYKVLTKFESINGNDEFTVGGQMNGSYTAGTLDMLIVTDKGEVYIYDMKATMSDDTEFNTRANEEYQGQVELYRRFINANSKLQVKDS
jgi:ATP-dependent exoDNAse (exonuclease V) beta subunit